MGIEVRRHVEAWVIRHQSGRTVLPRRGVPRPACGTVAQASSRDGPRCHAVAPDSTGRTFAPAAPHPPAPVALSRGAPRTCPVSSRVAAGGVAARVADHTCSPGRRLTCCRTGRAPGPLRAALRWEGHPVAGCCDPRGCDRMFGARFAKGRAAAYRRRGLDTTARAIVELLEPSGVAGATVLEIGGGARGIQLELLKRGAASATNLELSPAYESEAAALVVEAGFTGRLQRRLVDIATDPAAVEPADIVVLHRVVCCYPNAVAFGDIAADCGLHGWESAA